MATMRESFALFSLKQIRLEEARIREEDEVFRLRAAAEHHAETEATMRSRLALERKARDEAERRADEAKAEAMRVAAVERARAEAEVAARLEVMRIVQEHEKVLAALKEDKQKNLLGRAVRVGAVGSAVLFVAAAALYFGKIKPDTEARLRAQQAEIAAADEEAASLRQKLAERDERIRSAERALARMSGEPNAAPPPKPEEKPSTE